MTRYRDRDEDDSRADAFRCYGCELNIGRRGYCAECSQDRADFYRDLLDDTPKGGWHKPPRETTP